MVFQKREPVVVKGVDIYGTQNTGPFKFHRYFFNNPRQDKVWVFDGSGCECPYRKSQVSLAEEDKSSFIPEVWD